jgi:predicted acyltransferase
VSRTQRQQAIDATRGIAMLFVCLSHFAYAYFSELPTHAIESDVATRISLTELGLLPPNILIWTLGWPFQKQPPTPTYLGPYAGIGLLLLRAMMALDKHPRTRAWLAPAAMLGRVSLATFIAQYYVYFTLLKLWDPPYSPWWPLMFAVSLVVVFGISALGSAATTSSASAIAGL